MQSKLQEEKVYCLRSACLERNSTVSKYPRARGNAYTLQHAQNKTPTCTLHSACLCARARLHCNILLSPQIVDESLGLSGTDRDRCLINSLPSEDVRVLRSEANDDHWGPAAMQGKLLRLGRYDCSLHASIVQEKSCKGSIF